MAFAWWLLLHCCLLYSRQRFPSASSLVVIKLLMIPFLCWMVLCIWHIVLISCMWFAVDESILLPQFEEGTSLEEQLRVLLDRLETAQANYPCKYLVTAVFLSPLLFNWHHPPYKKQRLCGFLGLFVQLTSNWEPQSRKSTDLKDPEGSQPTN